LKTDPIVSGKKRREENEDELWEFADTVSRRRNLRYKEVELEYLLRVAIPVYTSNRPRLVQVNLEVEPISNRDNLDRIEAESQLPEIFNFDSGKLNIQANSVLVEDVEGAALATFASEQNTILIRTVVRAILKYLAFRRAEKKGEILGRLVDLVNVATERADTRSWETLPNQISLVRMPLPEGTHNVSLFFLDDDGIHLRTETLSDVKIEANGKTFLNYRTFE